MIAMLLVLLLLLLLLVVMLLLAVVLVLVLLVVAVLSFLSFVLTLSWSPLLLLRLSTLYRVVVSSYTLVVVRCTERQQLHRVPTRAQHRREQHQDASKHEPTGRRLCTQPPPAGTCNGTRSLAF